MRVGSRPKPLWIGPLGSIQGRPARHTIFAPGELFHNKCSTDRAGHSSTLNPSNPTSSANFTRVSSFAQVFT
jgi:hypothetical protein